MRWEWELDCNHEEKNLFNIIAIKTCCRTGNKIAGHWMREISRPTKYLLDRGTFITANVHLIGIDDPYCIKVD